LLVFKILLLCCCL